MNKILETPVRLPILFTCNIRRSVYESFGLSHFKQIKYYGMEIVPVLTDPNSGIEKRAAILKNNITKALDALKVDKAHIVSHSLSGLDMRYAISSLGLASRTQSLITISTPHHGSHFADIQDKQFFDPKQVATVTRAMGVYGPPLTESVAENMLSFNQVVMNDPSVFYFSIGGEKHPMFCSEALKPICKVIREKTKNHQFYENDGVNGHDQIMWGKHLANFEYDHFQIVGMNAVFNGEPFQLVRETARYVEGIGNDKEGVTAILRAEI